MNESLRRPMITIIKMNKKYGRKSYKSTNPAFATGVNAGSRLTTNRVLNVWQVTVNFMFKIRSVHLNVQFSIDFNK